MLNASRGRLRNFVSWIACLAILLGTVAPQTSHAIHRDAPIAWMDICTTDGAKTTSPNGTFAVDQGPSGPVDHLFQHCPDCSLNANAPGMPPPFESTPTLLEFAFGETERFLTARRTQFAWIAAQPRGPPRRV